MKIRIFEKKEIDKKYFLIIAGLLLIIALVFIIYSYSLYQKEENLIIANGIVGDFKICEFSTGTEWIFDYTGSEKEFIVPCNGKYKLETWGAQGGSYNSTCIGGYGAYSTGNIKLTASKSLYINVGGAGNGNGSHKYQKGGYNGGGDAIADSDGNTRQSSGGGATSINLKSGLLSSFQNDTNNVLIVASGGGGGAANAVIMCTTGGSGGGITGNSGTKYYESNNIWGIGYGGTQTSGGTYEGVSNVGYICTGVFGGGASCKSAGSGSGFFGGGSILYSAGGGSSYIGNSLLTDKVMYCYKCTESSKESTKTISTTNVSVSPISNYAKQGNGYAKITYLGIK